MKQLTIHHIAVALALALAAGCARTSGHAHVTGDADVDSVRKGDPEVSGNVDVEATSRKRSGEGVIVRADEVVVDPVTGETKPRVEAGFSIPIGGRKD